MTTAITPTGILLGQFTPGTPEWEKARGGLCITATEIAAVLGLSPWQSRFSLWHKKAGLPSPPFETNPAMEWGVRLEPAVAAKYADNHPDLTLHETGTWRHAQREWQRATPDRIADDRLVELKTSPTGDEWGPDGDPDGVPIHYRCQTLQQMDVLGYRRTDIAVLIGGCDYREYTVWFDETDAQVMRDAAERFLDDVRHGNRPDIDDSDATYQTIRRQPAGREDVDVQIPIDLADRYEATGANLRAAEAARRQAASEVLDLIGSGYRAVCGDRRIAYRTVNPDGTTHALQPYRSTAA
ncbi:YqaJ viral recombinase family protein [Streptomyces sp. DH37]|uniref:YqaJ viral recombinase family nuclease n=1 Tax=Streptomyces sp. DH37 TaxID=3040122 RepID=UPI0024414F8A|nr:YqaJ viral recombinase family protein [Streptomyces sp. DH37]MDG9701719.1 YqaJ viral recombinase family protein [Streptomyces sp. DH37]